MNGKISNQKQVSSLMRYTVSDGKEKGLDVIDCTNGKIRVLLNVSKALDIMQLYYEGQNVSFVSKNAYTPENGNFSGRFEGGMLYTCGLDCLGVIEGYEVHGTFHTHRADVYRTECTEDKIIVEGEIANTALFGKNLVMKRKITIEDSSVTVSDILENRGFRKEDFCLLYHVNIGYPMLDEGGRIIADVSESIPRTAYATEKRDEQFVITEPLPCQEETCYYLKLNEKKVEYLNERIGKKLTLEFNGEELNNCILWKSMASGDYALGIEPSTSELDERFRYSVIGPGESKNYNIRITLSRDNV